MFCTNCGQEIGDSKFCPHCGAEQPKAQAEPQEQVYAAQYGASEGSQVFRPFVSEVEDKYRSVFKDPLYLVICILYSISTVLAIFSGTSSTTVNVNGTTYTVSSGVSLVGAVLPILFTIALWLCFAAARSQGSFSGTGLAIASGSVKAVYIIGWVAVGILAVVAILMLLFGPMMSQMVGPALDDFFTQSSLGINEFPGPRGINDLPLEIEGLPFDIDGFLHNGGLQYVFIGLAIFFIVAIVILVLVNIFFYRNLHKFTKSLCTSLASGRNEIVKANTSRKWLMVCGILSVLGFAGSIAGSFTGVMNAAATACSAVTMILASILIKKSFVDGM